MQNESEEVSSPAAAPSKPCRASSKSWLYQLRINISASRTSAQAQLKYALLDSHSLLWSGGSATTFPKALRPSGSSCSRSNRHQMPPAGHVRSTSTTTPRRGLGDEGGAILAICDLHLEVTESLLPEARSNARGMSLTSASLISWHTPRPISTTTLW